MERISWPSNNVVQGGAFHQRHVNYSPATHDMIKSKTLLYWHDINPTRWFWNGKPLPPREFHLVFHPQLFYNLVTFKLSKINSVAIEN